MRIFKVVTGQVIVAITLALSLLAGCGFQENNVGHADRGSFDGASPDENQGEEVNEQPTENPSNQDSPPANDSSPDEETPNECPKAIPKASKTSTDSNPRQQLRVAPLETVQLTGQSSQDPDGDIESYRWTLTESPENSTARIEEPDIASTTFKPDLVGQYRIKLEVKDNEGTSDCGNDNVIQIDVIPCCSGNGITVELTWRTPRDPDPNDDEGSDLDLHYLNKTQGGQWGEAPWDAYFRNPEPDWGKSGSAGNPNLEVDETTGRGPERLNHAAPKPGTTYAVGAHYYREQFGATFATVKIFVRNELKYELRNYELPEERSFVSVAKIKWKEDGQFEIVPIEKRSKIDLLN